MSESFTSDLDTCLLSLGSWRCQRDQSYFPSATFGSVPRSVFSAGQVCRRSALLLCVWTTHGSAPTAIKLALSA